MTKEKQVKLIKRMIESGEIKQLKEIFDYYPITHIIDYLETNHKTLFTHTNDIAQIRAGTVYKIGNYFGVTEEAIMQLVTNQYKSSKPKRKK